MLTRLIYISLSALPLSGVQAGLQAITETSMARNASLAITGALLHTGTHFSQVLEGADDNVDTLMSSIRADQRHSNVLVIDHRPIDARLFTAWSMVYAGRAHYVQHTLNDCLARPDDPLVRGKLLRLLHEFARA